MDPARIRTLVPLALAIAFFATGVVWSFASPVGSSPDDDYHMASIWCPPPMEASGCRTGLDENGVLGVFVDPMIMDGACYAFQAEDSARCQTDIATEGEVLTTRVDQGGYPPWYYRFMNLAAGEDVARSILAMRLFNVAAAVGLLATLVAMAPAAAGRAMVFALVGSLVPLGMFLVASVNPSSWAITGVTALALALYTLLQARTRRTVGLSSIMVLIAAAMAAGSRGDAAIYVVLVVLAVSVAQGFGSYRRWSRIPAPAAAVVMGVASFLASGHAGAVDGTRATEAGVAGAVLLSNILDLPDFLQRLFSNLGWLDTIMPPLVRVNAGVVAAGLLVIGLGVVDRRKLAALALVVGAIIGLPLAVAQRNLVLFSAGDYPQPRYVLPLLPVVLFLALVPARGGSVRISMTQRAFFYGLIVIAHSVGLLTNLRRYVVGVGNDAGLLDVQWWWNSPIGPYATWAIGSAAFAIAALVLFAGVRSGTRAATAIAT